MNGTTVTPFFPSVRLISLYILQQLWGFIGGNNLGFYVAFCCPCFWLIENLCVGGGGGAVHAHVEATGLP